MIKIKLFEPDIHRNECSYRPYLFVKNLLEQIGIELITDATSYDFVMVGQASIIDKKKSLKESVEMGLKKLDSITGDYIIVDGQDATTLIGTVDVFRHVYKDKRCRLFLKPTYLKDFDLYKRGWNTGRIYWGEGKYSVPDIDDMKHKMKLAGFNWLSTTIPNWNLPFRNEPKPVDISAMFQYPMGNEVYEHEELQSKYYDELRRPVIEKLGKLEKKYSINKLINGVRLPLDQYYQKMTNAKVVIGPLGYGEITHRDLESSMFGSILIKNDMSHIETIPNPYVDGESYISVKWDWSNLEEKLDFAISEWQNIHKKMYMRFQEIYEAQNKPEKRAEHLYYLLKELDGIGTE